MLPLVGITDVHIVALDCLLSAHFNVLIIELNIALYTFARDFKAVLIIWKEN